MEGRDWLLRGCDEILVILAVTINHLVQLLVKLFQLGCLGHILLQHELGRLQRSVSPLGKKFETVVDEGLVEEYAPLSQEIATVTNYLDTTVRVIAVKSE